MSEFDENLYETRTNLLSSENVIDYLWRRCEKITFPFKPENAFGIKLKELDKDYVRGKDIMDTYLISEKDLKNSDMKKRNEYNIEIDIFQTINIENNPVSTGKLALIFKTDRKYYSLFEIIDRPEGKQELRLIMRVKQNVGLFGSFETEMIYYY